MGGSLLRARETEREKGGKERGRENEREHSQVSYWGFTLFTSSYLLGISSKGQVAKQWRGVSFFQKRCWNADTHGQWHTSQLETSVEKHRCEHFNMNFRLHLRNVLTFLLSLIVNHAGCPLLHIASREPLFRMDLLSGYLGTAAQNFLFLKYS